MRRHVDDLPDSESATATAEWMLVVGVVILLAWATELAVQTLVTHIFTRTAVIIASPMG